MSASAERLTRGRQRYTTVSVFSPVLVGRGICFLVVSTDGSFGRRLWFFCVLTLQVGRCEACEAVPLGAAPPPLWKLLCLHWEV